MRVSNLETHIIDRFVLHFRENRTESRNPRRSEAVLYLKCWGQDYPYLGVEPRKRWLPAVVDSGKSV